MSTAEPGGAGGQVVPIPLDLRRSLFGPRHLFSAGMSVLCGLLTLVALVPLFSVLYLLVSRGVGRLGLAAFTQLPPVAGQMSGGGFGPALAGTFLMVGIAALISVPLGVLAAVYLAEFDRPGQGGDVVRFAAKTLTGLPSILAGVFAFALLVRPFDHNLGFSAWAGGFALALLMLPTITLTAEESLRQVPGRMREAALGLGATQTQMVWRVVLPAALPRLITGVMLGVARAAGETAPLLLTATFSRYWMTGQDLTEPTASLAVLIYNFSTVPQTPPYRNQTELAWTAALVLVTFVLVLNLVSRYLIERSSTK